MSELIHPVTARLRLPPEHMPFSTLQEICQAGRLAPILGQLAPTLTVVSDRQLVFAGRDLFVIFSQEDTAHELDIAICKIRQSTLTAAAFSAVSGALARDILRFVMAIMPVQNVFWDCKPVPFVTEARFVEPARASASRPCRIATTAQPRRRPGRHAPRRLDVPRPAGLGKIPGLPDDGTLRAAVLPQAWTAASMGRTAARLGVLAVPLLLALAITTDYGRHPTFQMWADHDFHLSDLHDYQQTSAAITGP